MLLFLDGMAHYGSADIGVKYTARNDLNCLWSVVAEGRVGNCLKRLSTVSNTNQSGYLSVAPFVTQASYWAPGTTGVCGFAIKVDDLSKVGGAAQDGEAFGVLVIMEGGVYHLRVVLKSDGTFDLWRHSSLTFADLIAMSTEGLQSNSWAYVEFRWVLDDTAGTFEIRVNTIPVLTFAGRTTASTPLRRWNSVRLFSVNSGTGTPRLTLRVSDLYLADLTGGPQDVTDFLGDGIIQTIFPNGPGLAAAWTPRDATPNWDQVNDTPVPDGDATFVETTPPGTRDCHQFEDIPGGATVLGVHYNILARKVDPGTLTLRPIVGQGGVMYDGPTQGIASVAYDRYLTQPYDVNPATGVPWTAAEINAGQWGDREGDLMALLFMDSFDHYATADLTSKWSSLTGTGSISAGTGRRSSSSLQLQAAGTAAVLVKGLVPTGTTAIVGVAVNLATLPNNKILGFFDGAASKDQVRLEANADGSLAVIRSSATTPGGTGTGALLGTSAAGVVAAGVYAYLELKVVLHDTAGSVTARVNGVPVLTVTGVDTANVSLAWSAIWLSYVSASGTTIADFDDLYVLDGSGAAPCNDFLGDCRVDLCAPTAAGASTAWTPLAGANWDAVNDAAPDGDATYTSTSTVGATDTFVTQDVPVPGATLYGVQHCLSVKKTDSGVCTVAPVIRHAGVNYPGAAIAPGTAYAYGLQIAATNPGTGVAWVEADFNAAEFGYTRVS